MSTPVPPRIAVCSWSLRPCGADDLAGALGRVSIDAVQLALSPLVGAKPVAEALAYADRLRDEGVTIVSGMMAFAGEDYTTLETIARTGGVRPDASWPDNERHAGAVAALAARLGLDLVTFHAGFLPEDAHDPERAKLLDRLRVVADAFDARGIRVAFETGQETAATLLAALDDIDRPNVGVNFDPANMILYGKGDPVEALHRLAPHVRQVHVKDAMPAREPGAWGRETPAGAGAVPWDAFFDVALGLSPRVDFVIEREADASREEDIVMARDLVSAHMVRLEYER